MKWLYIFIDKEKNNLFNNQDVNLTGKYNFKYQEEHEENNTSYKIDVSYKKNFFEGFFDHEDTHIDITSIVGKNGSGKTSIINHLRRIYDENNDLLNYPMKKNHETKYIVIFEKEGKILLSQKGFSEEIEFNFNSEIVEEDKKNFNIDNEINPFNEFDLIYYSAIPNDFSYENDYSKHKDISLVRSYQDYMPYNYLSFYNNFKKQEIIRLLKYFSNNCMAIDPKNEKNFFNTIPINEMVITLECTNTETYILAPYSNQTDEEEEDFPIKSIEKNFRRIIENEKSIYKKIQILYIFFLIVRIYEDEKTDMFSCEDFKVSGISKSIYQMETLNDIKTWMNYLIEYKKCNVNQDKVEEVRSTEEIIKNGMENIEKYTKLLERFKMLETKRNTKIFDKETYSLKIQISENNDFLKELIKLMDESINLTDFIEIRYANLSSGEKSLFNLMAKFESVKIDKTSIFIIIDELDLYFHPDLQRQLINRLISFFAKLYKKQNIYMLFTTHSPIILSDIPKVNSIFLDIDFDIDTKSKKIKICTNDTQTFAQNIHSLYRNAFFLKDTIGEFSKKKINELILILNKDITEIEKEKCEIEKKINIIGEPVIKNKLLSIFNEKMDCYEKKSMSKRIKELEEKILELEGEKNDKN